ncbi:hypothetical protein ASPCAL00880 [Aspergillus calidoustus]|uniref:Gfo/Idh/MocA-like oxidoreductase N-terminal domain-containing protein n=1 Tax=Aspergillus calidoustus TaxID=454130 RepID=A0A0U5C1R1_ASPCI|nr:hypothetical protein ASPCAL00880 [Aspergillus calidoustus]
MECITALAAKGVAVLKEKPVAMEEYDWMLNFLVPIGIAFQKRFEPHFLHFRSLFPLVGRVAAVEASLALNITNLEETWRALWGWGYGGPRMPHARHPRVVIWAADFGYGAPSLICHVRLSRVAHRSSQYISVSGTDGTLTLDGHEITQYDTQGRETLNVKHQPTNKQVIHSMAQEFGD